MNIRHPNRLPVAQRGFALIVTLSLMILLTVVAVGLLTLSNFTLRKSGQDSTTEVARANARLALMMALGDLQTCLGPDTRISARAETLAKHDRVGGSVSPGTPQSWWVGVADSDKTRDLGTTNPQPVVWLVSGLNGTTAAASLSFGPRDPVTMVGEGSLDLAGATGGEPLQAGRVEIRNSAGKTSGSYAWFVDDNGMKAQLGASSPDVRNDSTAGPAGGPFGGGIIPGTFPVNILDRMDGLGSSTPEDLLKLVSTRDLPLVNLSPAVTKSKYFSYTTRSRGVLSDVKKGGLKKDLTIAFENSSVFSSAFPANSPDKYIVVDPAKRPAELANGYIHWGIFRDYYNLKKYIGTGAPTLAPTAFEKAGFVAPLATDSFRQGLLGPHAMTAASPSTLAGGPYGSISMGATGVATAKNPNNYRFNPIGPVLQTLQQTAWVTQEGASGSTPARARTHVQLFSSHYNPYNVSLYLASPQNMGPRVHNYPQVLFTVSGTTINQAEGLGEKLETHVPTPVTLEPGRSHVMGFSTDVARGSDIDGSSYSQNVGAIVGQSVYKDHTVTLPATGQMTLTFDFSLTTPALLHGLDDNPGNQEVSQVFYSPFAWDTLTTTLGSKPGKKVVKTATLAQLANTKATIGFRLRTTREPSSAAIRPLMDANIRAVWNNPRWDSPLGLPLLAAYSAEGNGEILNQPVPQMEIGSSRRGFTYWGNSRSPSTANDRVILFDVPRRDLVSIGQLQHANAGRFSYEPTYIVGNSYANPRISLGAWREAVSDTFSASKGLPSIPGGFTLYDSSYLVNDVIFDSYVFTTIPQVKDDAPGGDLAVNAATFSGLLKGTIQLPNPRYIPYRPSASVFTQARLQETGNAASGSFHHNAGHVMVDGAFNVNSTSVDAWEAFLSGTHQLAVQRLSADGAISGFHSVSGVRFPRAASHLQDGMASSSIDSSYWTGFRELEQREVRAIATRIVEEIRKRGPFLSMGEFVNRKLENSELGKSGTIQAALDATVNTGLNSTFESPAATGSFNGRIASNSTQGAGFPGQLLQGDVLQSLAPCMTVRSDTFTIRAYGEAVDAAGKVAARAWCEAVVQRLPDAMPVPSGISSSTMAQLAKPSSPFGRRFEMLSFRWLHPDEV